MASAKKPTKLHRRADFLGTVDTPTQLADGSIRIPARLARAGVQTYTEHGTGRTFREYRAPEVLFAPDVIAQWESLPVVVKHPPGLVMSPKNWKNEAIGHVGAGVKRDGDYLVGPLVVSDETALHDIADGKLIETSAGYGIEIDPTPGVSPEGEQYDQRVVRMVPNHVGIGEAGWGRGGRDVKMLVGDSAEGEREPLAFSDERKGEAHGSRYPVPMTPEQIKALQDKLALAEAAKTAAEKEATDAKLALEKANGERDAALALAKAPAPAATQGAAQPAAAVNAEAVADGAIVARLVAQRLELHTKIARIDSATGTAANPVETIDRSTGHLRSVRAIQVDGITKLDKNFRADGKSDAYVEAYFDMLTATKLPAQAPKHSAVRDLVAGSLPDREAQRADGGDNDEDEPAEKARLASIAAARTGGKAVAKPSKSSAGVED